MLTDVFSVFKTHVLAVELVLFHDGDFAAFVELAEQSGVATINWNGTQTVPDSVEITLDSTSHRYQENARAASEFLVRTGVAKTTDADEVLRAITAYNIDLITIMPA